METAKAARDAAEGIERQGVRVDAEGRHREDAERNSGRSPGRRWAPRGWRRWPARAAPPRRHTRKRAAGGRDPAVHQTQGEPSAGESADQREQRRNPGVPGGLPEREPLRIHQVLRGPVGPQRVAHHAQCIGRDEGPQAAVAQQFGVCRCRAGLGNGRRLPGASSSTAGIHTRPRMPVTTKAIRHP